MKRLIIIAILALVCSGIVAQQQPNFSFSQIPESHRKTLIRNAVTALGTTPFDYAKACSGKYPAGQGFLLHLNIYQIDPVSDGWLYWTLDKSVGPGSTVLVYIQEKSDFLREGGWGYFFCFYEKNVETTMTDLATGNQRKRTVPLFYSKLFGIRAISD